MNGDFGVPVHPLVVLETKPEHVIVPPRNHRTEGEIVRGIETRHFPAVLDHVHVSCYGRLARYSKCLGTRTKWHINSKIFSHLMKISLNDYISYENIEKNFRTPL